MSVEAPTRASTLVLRKPYMEKHRDSEDPTLRMSLTGASEEISASPSSPTMAGKRKQPELSSSGRFKAVSQLVVAMNRFKASLNPTYTFGKRQDSSSSGHASGWVRESADGSAQEASSAPKSPVPAEDVQPRQIVYSTRGHRTNYLLRSLPPTGSERRSRSQEVPDDH